MLKNGSNTIRMRMARRVKEHRISAWVGVETSLANIGLQRATVDAAGYIYASLDWVTWSCMRAGEVAGRKVNLI